MDHRLGQLTLCDRFVLTSPDSEGFALRSASREIMCGREEAGGWKKKKARQGAYEMFGIKDCIFRVQVEHIFGLSHRF